jgi:Leucine-rich repeat (LRR) protein
LASLPKTFADLTALTVLDLCYNGLTALPDNLFALPELTTLNLSHNLLPGLPFNSPFASGDGRSRSNQYTSGIFFTPAVARASTSLPRLVVLDVSYNQISAIAIDENIPVSLTKIDLSGNPLGPSQSLLRNLASLKRLKELKLEKSDIGNDSFPPTLFSNAPFPNLRLLDVSETQVTLEPVKGALKLLKQELNFDFTTEDPPEGVVRVLVGKRIIKEPWELELERRAKARGTNTTLFNDDRAAPSPPRRSNDQTSATNPTPISKTTTEPVVVKPVVDMIKIQNKPKVVKEAWEIEAEQGLLTEGGRRRARAAAAVQSHNNANVGLGMPSTTNSSSPPPLSPGSGLSNSQYFTSSTQTLRLPPSAPLTKSAGHSRAFSLAAPTPSALSLGGVRTGDISVPAPTLPLSVISTQPFAQTLRVLILANRRMDRSFALPSSLGSISGFLPCLEELDLEGCNLTDLVTVYPDSTSGRATAELILPTLAKLFPSLQTLNLSYNGLTNASLTPEALSTLILTSPHRKGLRHLRLRGNKFSGLDGFVNLAEAFKGNRNVPEWKLEELDLRDNEIGRLPPELGLLPLDVFLVDGNM